MATAVGKSSDQMLTTFVGFLRTRSSLIGGDSLDADGKQTLAALRERLDTLFKSPETATWDEAYAIERSILLLHRGEMLHQQVLYLLDDADEKTIQGRARLRALYSASIAKLYDSTKTPPALISDADTSLRYLGSAIIEATQWEMKKRFLAVPRRKSAAERVILVGIVSFVLFMVPYLVLYGGILLDHNVDFQKWTWIVQWNVLSAGLLGAFFSRLLYIQRNADLLNLEELESADSWRSILLRGAVGMIGALIVFYVLGSGLITGKLVPKPNESGLQLVTIADTGLAAGKTLQIITPMADLALLVVWCFLAGFSERLVPDILTAAESQLDTTATSKPPSST